MPRLPCRALRNTGCSLRSHAHDRASQQARRQHMPAEIAAQERLRLLLLRLLAAGAAGAGAVARSCSSARLSLYDDEPSLLCWDRGQVACWDHGHKWHRSRQLNDFGPYLHTGGSTPSHRGSPSCCHVVSALSWRWSIPLCCPAALAAANRSRTAACWLAEGAQHTTRQGAKDTQRTHPTLH